MSGLTLGLIVGGLVAAGLFGLWLTFRWAVRIRDEARARMAEIAGERLARRRSPANSFGIRSQGATQLRGAGYLALFDDELVFVQMVASNHVRARLADIVGVTTPRSFLGKTQAVRLLAVEWKVDGGTDQVALRVADLDGWLYELGQVVPATVMLEGKEQA